jgi:hypothetical protein
VLPDLWRVLTLPHPWRGRSENVPKNLQPIICISVLIHK